jgi:beta-lactam-binding protein with PASTA domain
MRSVFRYALLGLVLLTVALMSALTAMRLAIHGREVSVPKMVGMTPADAERVALANGLLLQVENRFYSAEVPEGRIVSQAPAAGARVRRGWRVRVAESLGPQRVVIPNVVGQSARAAELNLQRRGLELGTVAVAHLPDLPPDQIVAQSPPPNASGIASPKINLLISAPPEEQQYVMPDFVGRPLAEAAKAVEDAGFKLAPVKTVAVPAPNNGSPTVVPARAGAPTLIVRQMPAAGQRVPAGATVAFEIQ